MNKTEYKAYQKTVEKEISNYNHFCTGAASSCKICNPEGLDGDTFNAHNEDEGSFSWQSCELCGSFLGGDRFAAHGIEGPNHEITHYNICTDCVYYVNYGQLDDMSMLEIEA